MKRLTITQIVFVFAVYLLRFQTDADSIDLNRPIWEEALQYIFEAISNPIHELLAPPVNRISSIEYHVYTALNPKIPCLLEPNRKSVRNCKINPEHLTIFIIHGFLVDLIPGNLFEVMKDVLLSKGDFNVIIVDWTKYDGPPYRLAIANVYLIGGDIADLIKYLMKYAGIKAENVVFIGHSLGAHMAGAVGRQLKNLRRIDGLDPAGPYYGTPILPRLSFTDAGFVQVMHTSDDIFGIGLYETMGHLDFYVNGGRIQPMCLLGNKYIRPTGEDVFIENWILVTGCNHEMSVVYYIHSINNTDCKFTGTLCTSYDDFVEGRCTTGSFARGVMGVYGTKLPDIPPLSRFYLRTSSELSYCLNDGHTHSNKEHF